MKSPPARPNAPEGDFYRVNRFRLREFLSEGVDVRFEHKLETFELVDGGVKAKFENGAEVEGRMLVGADGVHSTGNTHARSEFSSATLMDLYVSPQAYPP